MNADPVTTRNRAMGLYLGGIVVGLVGLFIYQFSTHGLPKDPKLVKQQERAERSGAR